ncbi:RNA directed DNA polymerase (reverse transcriptase) [Echinococcus multilocularis]|uniref:RNA directed DNA polymerase (Reverse transcriptase) n=1 Tax=Echinococcus multilocularis TaxID=6211 RepID=A0A0S4MQR3_ECHMU|nr:RNA directed DNA polymerase (reverse transcriptase) [Echinococcus multilocularis]
MVYTPTGTSVFKILTGSEVSPDIFLPTTDETANNVPEYILRLKEGAKEILRPTQPDERLPRRISANLQANFPTWKTPQVSSPMEQGPISSGSALTCKLHNYVPQPVAVHQQGPPPVGHEDETYAPTKDRKPPNGSYGRNSVAPESVLKRLGGYAILLSFKRSFQRGGEQTNHTA